MSVDQLPIGQTIVRDPDTQANKLKVNADGSLNVTTTISGVATETTLESVDTSLNYIETNTGDMLIKQQVANVALASIDNKTPALVGGRVPVNISTSEVVSSSSTTTPLTAGNTFTGAFEDVSAYPAVVVAVKTDQNGTLYVEFSPDGVNVDSSLVFYVYAGINDVHRLSVTRKYFRVRYTNTSASDQTYFRMQAMAGQQTAVTSSLNSTIQSDADALTVRPLEFNLMVAEGLYENRSMTVKDGMNLAISTATVPEDISNESGVYAGFPTGAVEAGQIIVAGADTGTVYYSYMASATDTDYTFGSKAITGAGTYALGHNIWRCNFAYFVSSNSTAFNAGDITIRNTPTTANVFCVISAGYSQSFCAAYTVPYGSAIYLDRVTANLRGSATGQMDGVFWYRPYGESPRQRFPFELQYGALYFDDINYLIKIPERTDIIPRITYCSVNNLAAKISYRFVKIKP